MIRKRENILGKELDGEFVILDHVNGKIHKFNIVASHIWKALDTCERVEDIVHSVCEAFEESDIDKIRHDIGACLQQLSMLDLIEISPVADVNGADH